MQTMVQRVLIKVAGFTDAERQTLNLLVRLSEDSDRVFVLWAPDLALPPVLAVVDGEAPDAAAQLSFCRDGQIPLIWIGPAPPPQALRSFERPLAWPDVVDSIDEILGVGPPPIDLGFGDSDAMDTQPSQLEPPAPRALIAAGDLSQRLYLRARLALAGLTQADDAVDATQMRDWIRAQHYVVALVDFELPGAQGWAFIRELARLGPEPTRVIVIKDGLSLVDRWHGRRAGVAGLFDKPPDPVRLAALLEQLR
jgi:CheY-like chemotaxis protein